jgi:hypothetical protein
MPGLDAPPSHLVHPGRTYAADAKPGHTCAHSLLVYVLLLTLVMPPLHEVVPNKSGFLVISGLHCTCCMSPATGRTDMISATHLSMCVPFRYLRRFALPHCGVQINQPPASIQTSGVILTHFDVIFSLRLPMSS